MLFSHKPLSCANWLRAGCWWFWTTILVRVSQVDGHRAPSGICAPAKLRPTFLDSVRRFTRRCFQLMAGFTLGFLSHSPEGLAELREPLLGGA